MVGVINTGSFPKALWEGVNAWFGQKYDQHSTEYTALFDTYDSRKNYEEDVQAVSFGLAPEKSEGVGLIYDSMQQGYVSRYTHVAYALGFIVTREEQDDNLYEELSMKRAGLLAYSMAETKENVGANIYNRAFNSSFVGGDGVELLSTAHPNSVGGGTYSNELNPAADLSEQSLEDLCIQIGQAQNDRGLKIALKPKRLIIPVNLQFEATRILKSTLQSNTGNNDINALRSMNMIPEMAVNHYLTDTDAWFIKTDCPEGLKHFNRVSRKLENDNDFDTKNLKASAYERYSFKWSDPKGLYGSSGA